MDHLTDRTHERSIRENVKEWDQLTLEARPRQACYTTLEKLTRLEYLLIVEAIGD